MNSELQNQKYIINNKNEKKDEKLNENKNIKNNSDVKNKNDNYNNSADIPEENYRLFISKRSYSCKINEPKNRKFPKNDDINLNLNNKFMYLKTPQIKPQKGQLIIKPINIGSISSSKKKSRFNLLNVDNDNMKDIISEGENEESNECSFDSSEMTVEEEEVKENSDKENNDKDQIGQNIENLNINEIVISKLKSEKQKFSKNEESKIEEENDDDDYDEKGQISLKNLRKGMIQSKRKFSKNDNDMFSKIDNNLNEKYKKYKEDILMGNKDENESNGFKLHKTVGFGQSHRKSCLPILDFLRKNSMTGIKIKNN